MVSRKDGNNHLTHSEIMHLTKELLAMAKELAEEKPLLDKLAERLTRSMGFTVTEYNVLHVIQSGVIEDWRPHGTGGTCRKYWKDHVSGQLQQHTIELAKKNERDTLIERRLMVLEDRSSTIMHKFNKLTYLEDRVAYLEKELGMARVQPKIETPVSKLELDVNPKLTQAQSKPGK